MTLEPRCDLWQLCATTDHVLDQERLSVRSSDHQPVSIHSQEDRREGECDSLVAVDECVVSAETLHQRLARPIRQFTQLQGRGEARWQQVIAEVVPSLQRALAADYVVLGGGMAGQVEPLPSRTRRGGNEDAVIGGERLWREVIEPDDRKPSSFWRVVP